MACSYCYSPNCTGQCLNINGALTVCALCGRSGCNGTCISTGIAAGGYMYPYGQIVNQAQQIFTGTTSIFAMEASLHNFLEIIADKSDTDACVTFMEQQRILQLKQIQELERLKKQYQDDLEKGEKEFLAKCQKYRPSITPEVLVRIKDLKAFY